MFRQRAVVALRAARKRPGAYEDVELQNAADVSRIKAKYRAARAADDPGRYGTRR